MSRLNRNVRIVNNRLMQIGQAFRTSRKEYSAVFRCSCGSKTLTTLARVKSGKTTSCGCFRLAQISAYATNHGHTKNGTETAVYRSWTKIHSRCKAKPGSHHWPYYGAKGITVCERWKTFDNFVADMGHRPDGHTIDRIDGTKGYSPENCRWATKAVQCLNVSDIRMITFENKTLCMKEWARETGIKYLTLRYRLESGWSVEKALTTPARQMKQRSR